MTELSAKLPDLAVTLLIPVILVAVANWIRRTWGLSTSTGGDLLLSALLVDASLLILSKATAPLGLTPAVFRAGLVIAALGVAALFYWSVRLQRVLDERSMCRWANSSRPHLKRKFHPELAYQRSHFAAMWVLLNTALALHAWVLLRL